MSVPVDSLELRIESNSSAAVNGIDALSASLSKLKVACAGGVGLTPSLAKNIEKISTATAGMGNASESLNRLAESLTKLKSVGQIKLSSSIAHQLQNINSALTGAKYDQIGKLGEALQSLSTIPKLSFTTLANSLTKLNEAVKTLDTDTLSDKFKRLNESITPLASNVTAVSSAMRSLTPALNRAARTTSDITAANNRTSSSFIDLYAKAKMFVFSMQKAGNVITDWVDKSNKYIEDVNLFTASLGEYAGEAQKYAEQVSELLGLDPGDFLRNQGVFNTIIEGFGVASDKAYLMSKNLTQLGYDIASFYNIDVEDAMTKLTSGISGELEPLRRLGYDLSVARLQEDALALGIQKKVSAMNQAEKAQLRYYEILTQVTVAQGDMARTLNSPANQLRIFQAQVNLAARALGNVFIPMLNAVLPYLIAFAKIVRLVAEIIASFFHYKLPAVDYSGINAGAASVGKLSNNANNAASGLGKAAKKAKELKNNLLGIDELNVISPQTNTGSGSGSGVGSGGIGGGDLGIDLPQYDFLKGLIDTNVNDIFERMKKLLKDILAYAIAIAAAFAAWKIAKGILDFLNFLKNLKGMGAVGGLAGLLAFLGDIVKMKRYISDIMENGFNLYNVMGVISSFIGMVGDALIMMGSWKIGGALKVVQGVGEIVAAIASWKINGFNSNVVLTALEGVADIITGIGFLKQNLLLVGTGLTFTGLLGILRQLDEVMKAIKTGNWDAVDKIALVVNAVQFLGGLAIALKGFGRTELGTTIGTSISTALQDLLLNATINLGLESPALAAAILSAAAGAIIAGIPMYIGGIIDAVKNGLSLISAAVIPIGSTLAGTGVATILAAAGTAIAPGIGTLVGLAVGLITDGIILIIQNWDKITDFFTSTVPAWFEGTVVPFFEGIPEWFHGVWDKVSDFFVNTWNDMIAFFEGVPDKISQVVQAIGDWFAQLPGKIGYALGYALGTIVNWVVNVGTTLQTNIPIIIENVRAWFAQLPGKIWSAIIGAIDFVITWGANMLSTFGTKVTEISTNVFNWFSELPGKIYTAIIDAVPKIIAWASEMIATARVEVQKIVTEIVGIFKQLPKKLYELGTDIISGLMNGIRDAWNGLKKGVSDFCGGFVQGFRDALGIHSPSTEFKSVGEYSIEGLINGINEGSAKIQNAITGLAVNMVSWFEGTGIVSKFTQLGSQNVEGLNSGLLAGMESANAMISQFATSVQTAFTTMLNPQVFIQFGMNIVTGFNNGIATAMTATQAVFVTWANSIKTWFSGTKFGSIEKTTFGNYAKTVVTGFNGAITSNSMSQNGVIVQWATNVKKWFVDNGFGAVNRVTFEKYGKDIVDGFRNGVLANYISTQSVMNSWGRNVIDWFNRPDGRSLYDHFVEIGKNVIRGFIDGSSDGGLWSKAQSKIREFSRSIIEEAMKALDEHSPSKTFKQIGSYVVEGFNIGLDNMIPQSFKTMDSWLQKINGYQPVVRADFVVDTSSVKFADSTSFMGVDNVSVTKQAEIAVNGYKEGMAEFYEEYMEPMMRQMSEDIRRQANKKEQTVVQIGNRTVSDAVVTQRNANGYRFVTEK